MSWLNKAKFRKKVCVNILGLGFAEKGTTAGVSKETAGNMFKDMWKVALSMVLQIFNTWKLPSEL